jgi:hypothetical protein
MRIPTTAELVAPALRRRVAMIMTFGILIAGCARSLGPRPPGEAPRRSTGKSLHWESKTVSAETILRSYANNPESADDSFNDKIVRITEVRVDQITKGRVVVRGETLELRLLFADKSSVRRLHKDDLIAAECEGDGMRRNSFVAFEHCQLLERTSYLQVRDLERAAPKEDAASETTVGEAPAGSDSSNAKATTP